MVAVHVVDPQEGDFTSISTAICTCVCVLMLREDARRVLRDDARRVLMLLFAGCAHVC